MYRPGKAMKCGTRDTAGDAASDVSGRTAIVDLKATSPAWAEASAADQMIGRRNHNLVILPNGEVLVVGGALYGANHVSNDANCVKMPQFWNPDTLAAGHWYGQERNAALQLVMKFDSSTVRRHYHSTAVLMPDSRILVAGGAPASEAHRLLADIYSPYYLFNANGTPATRPVIQNAPARVSYGERFSLRMGPNDNQLSKVTLLRPGATTHGFDQNQRFVPLTFSVVNPHDANERRFLVNAPADSFDAPPGDYLLFALNAAGTPAIAWWIKLRATNNDVVVPAEVVNLTKECYADGTVELRWTPPCSANVGSGVPCPGPASRYELRYRVGTMNDWTEFYQGAVAPNPPQPSDPVAAPGQTLVQAMTVSGLTPSTTYAFRLISKDYSSGSGNWSALSNPITFTTYNEQCGGAGGGGGGGGFEDPLTAENALTFGLGLPAGGGNSDTEYLENTLFANAPPATPAVDLLRLPHGPRWTATGARIRLSRRGTLATRFTGIRLRGVALSPGQSAFAADSEIVVGTLAAPAHVLHSDGRDLTASLASGKAFEGHPSDTLVVEFGDPTPGRIGLETSGAQLVSAPFRTGVELQCVSGGSWRTVAHHDPRALRAVALYGVPSAGKVRLIFRGDHQLHAVARFEPGASLSALAHEPAAVTHSRLGDIGSGIGGDGILLAGGEHALVDFAVPSEQANGLDWFLEVTGEHVAIAEVGLAANQEASTEAPPADFALEQYRPNPFEGGTSISFELPRRSAVRLEVYDLLGRRVAVLANETYEPGRHSVSWDGRGSQGVRLAPGIYACRLTAGEFQEQRRLVLFP